jgi:hypothetical protein
VLPIQLCSGLYDPSLLLRVQFAFQSDLYQICFYSRFVTNSIQSVPVSIAFHLYDPFLFYSLFVLRFELDRCIEEWFANSDVWGLARGCEFADAAILKKTTTLWWSWTKLKLECGWMDRLWWKWWWVWVVMEVEGGGYGGLEVDCGGWRLLWWLKVGEEVS